MYCNDVTIILNSYRITDIQNGVNKKWKMILTKKDKPALQ